MLQFVKLIYKSLPIWTTRWLACIPDPILFGKGFRSAEILIHGEKGYLERNLYNALLYAREYTDYGRETISNKLVLDNVIEVYNGLPILDSSQVSENLNYYKSREYTAVNSYMTTTGGTGRNPSTICLSNKCYGIEWAHMLHIWSGAGYKRSKNLKLTLRGKSLPAGQLVRYNPVYNELVADFFQVNVDNFSVFYTEIKKYNVSCLHGYPSLIMEFMNYLKQFNLSYSVSMIFLGSEGATVIEKNNFSEFFSALVISWYGQTEKVILAADFEATGKFLNYNSYGYASVDQPDENGFGEILGTTFVNKALPLIKYRTGDYATIDRDGDKIWIKDIQGRWGKDFVYLNAEKKIPTSSINLHGSIQSRILFYQLVQNDYAKLSVRLLPKDKDDKLLASDLCNELQLKLKGFQINVHIVDQVEIERSKRGKMIMLVQYLK